MTNKGQKYLAGKSWASRGRPLAINQRTAGESAWMVGREIQGWTETTPETKGVEVASPVEGAHPLVVSMKLLRGKDP